MKWKYFLVFAILVASADAQQDPSSVGNQETLFTNGVISDTKEYIEWAKTYFENQKVGEPRLADSEGTKKWVSKEKPLLVDWCEVHEHQGPRTAEMRCSFASNANEQQAKNQYDLIIKTVWKTLPHDTWKWKNDDQATSTAKFGTQFYDTGGSGVRGSIWLSLRNNQWTINYQINRDFPQ